MHSYAQFGEDVKLHRLLPDGHGVYVEVGGNDGVECSNTYFFEKLGRRCIVVEPIPYLAERIRSNRSCTVVEVAADSAAGEARFLVARGGDTLSTLDNSNRSRSRIDEHADVESIPVATSTLDTILKTAGLTPEVDSLDLVSIDVEGNEGAVLQGFSVELWKPRVIIVEDNSFGRDCSILERLAACGYTRFRITGVNHWYCRDDDKALNRARYRVPADLFARIVRIYGIVSGRGRVHRHA